MTFSAAAFQNTQVPIVSGCHAYLLAAFVIKFLHTGCEERDQQRKMAGDDFPSSRFK